MVARQRAHNLSYQGRCSITSPRITSTYQRGVNDGRLRTASEASQRSTKEDWEEWMRHFSFELLKESPSPALRTCARLAQLQPFVKWELFAVGFVSCWSQLSEDSTELVEFMEHDERPLPIDICLMGALAGKDDAIKAYTAKASQASSPHLCLDATLGL
uniref:Fkbp-rapamycin associated protein n=1 Tax=Solanum tuberosum TaxID=4113 RepID=M1A3F5_SOLTU